MGKRPLAVQLLIRYAADPLAADSKGRVPLHWLALHGLGSILDSNLCFRPDAFGGLQAFVKKDCDGRVPWQLARYSNLDCCVRWQFLYSQAWVRQRLTNRPALPLSCNLPQPKQLSNVFMVLATPALHLANAALLVKVLLPELFSHRQMTPELLFLAFAQGISQLMSLLLFVIASSTDPGYAKITTRLNSTGSGFDGHERIVDANAKELESLIAQRNESRQAQLIGRTHDTQTAVQQELELAQQIQVIKNRMAEALKHMSNERLACYPQPCVALAFSQQVEGEPDLWGRKACVLCCRMRDQRCRHCRDCGRCVARFDHHCPWIGNCVGVANVLTFFRFLSWTFFALLAALGLSWQTLSFMPAAPSFSNEWPTRGRFCTQLFLAVNSFLALCIGSLLLRQMCLVSADLTEYESSKGSSACSKLRTMSAHDVLENLLNVQSLNRSGSKVYSSEMGDQIDL